MADNRLCLVTLLGFLVVQSLGCTHVFPLRSQHREVRTNCAMPLCDQTPFEAVSPIPQSCRRTRTGDDAESAVRTPPPPLPRIPTDVDTGIVNSQRITQLEIAIRHLREQIHQQQEFISAAERSRMADNRQFQNSELERAIGELRQAQAETRLHVATNSQKLRDLAKARESDLREHARVLDEIISGLELALSPIQNAPR